MGGCEICDGNDFNSNTEIFDFASNEWIEIEAEFESNTIFAAPIVWLNGSFHIIGGQVGLDNIASDEVYQLDIEGGKWNHVGSLETARFGHAAISTDNGFIVFGGDS